MIIEIIDITAIILLRVSLLLTTWSSVNILFYLFRYYYYYYYYFFVVHAACRTTRSVPMNAELGFSRSLRGKGKNNNRSRDVITSAFEISRNTFSLCFSFRVDRIVRPYTRRRVRLSRREETELNVNEAYLLLVRCEGCALHF